jgi:hypothetical protein
VGFRVVEDIDIWRTAKLLVNRHSKDAPIVAAQRCDELLDAGDLDGQRTWKRILAAIDKLVREAPKGGEKDKLAKNHAFG